MLQSLDVPDIVRETIRLLTTISVPVVAVVALVCLWPLTDGRAGRKRLQLAFRGLSEGPRPWGSLLRMAALPLVGLTSLTVSFGIEQEVREGPARSIDALTLGPETSWVLEAGTDHLMNVSSIEEATLEDAVAELSDADLQTTPFYASLVSVETAQRRLTGYVFAADQALGINPVPVEGHGCSSPDGSPCLIAGPDQIVVDPGNGIEVGDSVTIRSAKFKVIGHSTAPRSLINRLVVYVSVEGFAKIEETPDPFGLVVVAEKDEVAEIVSDQRLQVLSVSEIKEANENFWAGNGTPLLLLLIGLISAFAATATFLGERAEQERNRFVLGTLWAIGLSRWQMVEVQFVRSATAVAIAVPFAWVVSGLILWAANQSIIGFSAERTLGHLVAASALLLVGASLAAMGLARKNRDARPFEIAA